MSSKAKVNQMAAPYIARPVIRSPIPMPGAASPHGVLPAVPGNVTY